MRLFLLWVQSLAGLAHDHLGNDDYHLVQSRSPEAFESRAVKDLLRGSLRFYYPQAHMGFVVPWNNMYTAPDHVSLTHLEPP